MAKSTSDSFDFPPELRAFTERSMEQARTAFEGFMTAAHRTVSSLEGQTATARKNARDFGQNAMTFATQNVASSFDLAQRLLHARGVDEVLRLQADYINGQMHALAEHAEKLREQISARAKEDGARPH